MTRRKVKEPVTPLAKGEFAQLREGGKVIHLCNCEHLTNELTEEEMAIENHGYDGKIIVNLKRVYEEEYPFKEVRIKTFDRSDLTQGINKACFLLTKDGRFYLIIAFQIYRSFAGDLAKIFKTL